MRIFRVLVLAVALSLLAAPAPAQPAEGLERYETRPGVDMPVYRIRTPGARAALLLISGGAGGMGRIEAGRPTSRNFLVRSREYFAAEGFEVAVLGLPADKKGGWSAEDRLSPEHMEELRAVVRRLKAETGLPVWLVGTSMGTVSATAAAIALGPQELDGVVLTSSVTGRKKTGAVPTQDLKGIRVPLLVVHHALDACRLCVPSEAANIARWAENAPVKKFLLAEGGSDPQGDPCEALHYHGFINMEREAVRLVTDWVKNPAP